MKPDTESIPENNIGEAFATSYLEEHFSRGGSLEIPNLKIAITPEGVRPLDYSSQPQSTSQQPPIPQPQSTSQQSYASK